MTSGVPRMKDEKQPDQRSFDGAHYWLVHSDLEEAHSGEEGWSAVAGARLFVGTGRALLEHPIAPDTRSFTSNLRNLASKCMFKTKTWFV